MDSKPSRHKLKSIRQDETSEARSLPLKDLRKMTNNFSNERLLGQGGFGKVYKGELQNGDIIAVKKLTCSTPGVQDEQFENEAHTLMRLKHPNIVQLVGYCSETENIVVQYNGKFVCAEKRERLLCLEYLPNGSLYEHLSDEFSGLDWDTRYKIIKGICSGLHYLHKEWLVPIIHMDLKPENILLDNNMVPKITDFGLSRLFGADKTRICTQSRDGTLGYMAPEYLHKGIITQKLDIFSLGVIILEIITGHKDYPDESETAFRQFMELVIKNWRNRLEEPWCTSREIDCQQIRHCIQVGLICVKLDRTRRPTISEIMKMLDGSGREDLNIGEVLRPPANQVVAHWAYTSSGASQDFDTVEDCEPKRRFIEVMNPVEMEVVERPAMTEGQDDDTRGGDGRGGTGGSAAACAPKRARMLTSDVTAGGGEEAVCVDAQLWLACAGVMCTVPPVGAAVYYFPQGHAEQATESVDLSATRVPPSVPCRVVAVRYMADPRDDEVFVKMSLVPLRPGEPVVDADNQATTKLLSFAKTLTLSDANDGGGFSVPRYCAETIFPMLDYRADPPVQTVLAKDVHGEIWKFRHIYRGTPRRHLLTTGWSTFVKQKKLIAGDCILFLRGEGGDLYVGTRRARRGGAHSKGQAGPAVLKAARLAATGQQFEVVYYPRASSPEFCVRADAVRAAMRVQWSPGMRFKLAFETEDSSRISWFIGTIAGVQTADPARWPQSPWRLLQVVWDEPDLLGDVKLLNPWLVELVSTMPAR